MVWATSRSRTYKCFPTMSFFPVSVGRDPSMMVVSLPGGEGNAPEASCGAWYNNLGVYSSWNKAVLLLWTTTSSNFHIRNDFTLPFKYSLSQFLIKQPNPCLTSQTRIHMSMALGQLSPEVTSLTRKGTAPTTHWRGAVYQVSQLSPKERAGHKRKEHRAGVFWC